MTAAITLIILQEIARHKNLSRVLTRRTSLLRVTYNRQVLLVVSPPRQTAKLTKNLTRKALTIEEFLVALAKYLYDKPEIWGGIFAGAGLIFTARAFLHQQKSDQIKLAESVFKDLRLLEKEQSDLNTEIMKKGTTDFLGTDADRLRADWRSRFFNTLEWLAFLINENELSNAKIVGFYKEAIIDWYEEIFLKQASENERNDAKQYPELKKLYNNLKNGKPSRWRMKHDLD